MAHGIGPWLNGAFESTLAHAQRADQRRDATHKLTTQLIHENQVVTGESLQVKNLLQNRSLARALSDVGWHTLTLQFAYKAKWYGCMRPAISCRQARRSWREPTSSAITRQLPRGTREVKPQEPVYDRRCITKGDGQ